MTNQNTELAKVKARIKALLDRTVQNGCTEQEALVAAGLVGKLLEQYSLTMSEIDVREEKCVTVEVYTDSAHRDEMWHVAFTIGEFCGCKVWFRGGGGHYSKGRYFYFGQETDAKLAVYLFEVIQKAVKTEVARFKTTDTYRYADVRRTASDSFKRGMCRRIGARLNKLAQDKNDEIQRAEQEKRNAAREQAAQRFEQDNADRFTAIQGLRAKLARGEAAAEQDFEVMATFDAERMAAAERAVGANSLIVLKGQLVQKEYDDLGMKVRSVKMKHRSVDYSAETAGRAAGNRVNLNRPLTGGSATAGLLA